VLRMCRVKVIGYDNSNFNNFIVEPPIFDDQCGKFIQDLLFHMDALVKAKRIDVIDANTFTNEINRQRDCNPSFVSEQQPGMSGNIVGVYHLTGFEWGENQRTYDVDLEIKSRFDNTKPYFLARMMLSMLLNDDSFNRDMIIGSLDDIFDFLLVFKFRRALLDAYTQSFYKSYQRYEKNDDKLRGTIDISRHIKLNMGLGNGKVAYSVREMTIDNSLNHLFLHAYECICKRYPKMTREVLMGDCESKSIISKLYSSCHSFYSSNVKSVMSKHLRPIGHPYFRKYETLRLCSIDILRKKGISPFFDDVSEETPYMLFYAPDLWEAYAKELLNRNSILCAKYEMKIMALSKEVVTDSQNDYTYGIKTIPDYLLTYRNDEAKGIAILDAKYRPIWEKWQTNPSFVQADYTKCLRDMIDFGVHRTGVVIPSKGKNTLLEKHRISRYNDTDYFYILSLKIIDTEKYKSYSEWLNVQKEEESIFVQAVSDILK